MARNKSPYDFLKEHIRGIYFPLHYGKPEPVQMSLSRSGFQNRPFEAVVKIVSHIKAGRGPLTAMRYIAEKSEGLEEVRPLYDEEGTLLRPEDFERKLSEMPKPERKDGRQLAHIVVSFPKAARMTAEKTERFMQKYLEPFAERGFKFVYCSHVHQSAVHGHVLLCETNGRERLRFGKKELMMMRQHQVEVGKAFGLNMRASYCNEREICIDGTKAKPKRKTLLERNAAKSKRRGIGRSGLRPNRNDTTSTKRHNERLTNGQGTSRNRNGRSSFLSKCSPKTAARRSGMQRTTPKCSAKRKRPARPLSRQAKLSG